MSLSSQDFFLLFFFENFDSQLSQGYSQILDYFYFIHCATSKIKTTTIILGSHITSREGPHEGVMGYLRPPRAVDGGVRHDTGQIRSIGHRSTDKVHLLLLHLREDPPRRDRPVAAPDNLLLQVRRFRP